MDVPTIATAALAFLSPYLQEGGKAASKKIAESVIQQGDALRTMIREKFANNTDDYAVRTLERFEAKPDDEGRQAVLRAILIDEAEGDSAFRDELVRLVEAVSQDRAITQFVTNVSGDARVEKLVNIGSAHTVRIE